MARKFHQMTRRGTTILMGSSKIQRQYWSIAALVLGAVAIAFAGIFAKDAVSAGYMGELAVGFWRLALALPVFLLVMLVMPKRKQSLPAACSLNPIWLLLPGVLFACDIGFWHFALSYTTVSNSTLLVNIQVFIVGFFGWLLLKERIRAPYLIGLLIACAGIWVLLTNGEQHEYAPRPALGDGLSIAVAFWYASYLLLVKVLRRDFRTIEILVATCAVGAAILFIAATIHGEQLVPVYMSSSYKTTPEDYQRAWTNLILLALIPQCIGQGLITWGISRLPVSFSAIVLLLQPVCAALLSWYILSEVLNSWQIGASIAVIIGIVLAKLGIQSINQDGSNDNEPSTHTS
jgi:drug/metabolite transporter (DMT)-like permease